MDLEVFRREIKSINTLVLDGIITEETAEKMKNMIVDRFMKEYSAEDVNKLPNDLEHLPGRLVAGVFGALSHINGARCAGVDDNQQGCIPDVTPTRRRAAEKRARSPQEMMDGLPDMYK